MRRPTRSSLAILVTLVALLIFIRACDLDMRVARWFYTGGTWEMGKSDLFRGIYNFGVLPALIVSLGALAGLLGGIGRPRLARFRKICGFLVLSLVVGSGIVSNLLLKDNWGRPRPSQIDEFGGAFSFEPTLSMDLASSGKSFPCGHATMGFYFFALAMVMPCAWKWRRGLTFALGLFLGSALGLARMAQGGHFLSDVIWAAAIMWFVPLGIFHAMKMGPNRMMEIKPGFRTLPVWVTMSFMPLLLVGLAAGTLGTPYEGEDVIYKAKPSRNVISSLTLETEADVILKKGSNLKVETKQEGFGLPKSSIRHIVEEEPEQHLMIRSMRKGFFTELRQQITVTLPEGCTLEIISSKGKKTIVGTP